MLTHTISTRARKRLADVPHKKSGSAVKARAERTHSRQMPALGGRFDWRALKEA